MHYNRTYNDRHLALVLDERGDRVSYRSREAPEETVNSQNLVPLDATLAGGRCSQENLKYFRVNKQG